MPKKSADPFRIWSSFQLWHFFQGGTKLPGRPKVSPIDGISAIFEDVDLKILFVLFCNDVPSHIGSSFLMYADDLKLYRQIRCPGDALTLQTDLNSLYLWSVAWKLSLNPSKCKTITFSPRKKPIESSYHVNNITLERMTEIRDLGILFDSKLTFGPHIDSVVGKANRALGMYLRSLQSYRAPAGRRFPPGPIIAGFNAHIRSSMEFGRVIWSGAAKPTFWDWNESSISSLCGWLHIQTAPVHLSTRMF